MIWVWFCHVSVLWNL